MTGPLEPTNESYAVAKIAGIQLARSLQQEGLLRSIVVIPPNIYGPNDHFDLDRAHVLSSLIRRFTDAVLDGTETIKVWGTGSARREFMHSDDLADAVFFLISNSGAPFIVNVGVGTDVSIRDVAKLIAEITEFAGEVVFDPYQPEGMPQKLLDNSVLCRLGWHPRIALDAGLRQLASEYRSKINV
jgi:GDP-L-fucose synthase